MTHFDPKPAFSQVYIAGAYSHHTQIGVQANILAAVSAAKALLYRHYLLPILPHTMGPHHGISWEEAMVRCRGLICGLDRERDAVVMLPGWEQSKGATEERELAISLGIRVMNLEEVLK